ACPPRVTRSHQHRALRQSWRGDPLGHFLSGTRPAPGLAHFAGWPRPHCQTCCPRIEIALAGRSRCPLIIAPEDSMKFSFPILITLVLGEWISPLDDVVAAECDVVVYGSTPGGFCAAIGAAREGASVILLEPTNHVGGVNTGGLCFSDS